MSVVSQNRFKETRAGSVPADWDFVSIESIGEVITGRTPSTKVSEYYGGKYKLISPANLGESMYVTTAHKWLTEDGLSVSRVLPKDTVLVSCIGYIGKTGLTADDKSATNQQINAIKCNEKADPKFVFFLLTHLQNYLETFARVTTVPILNKTNFKSIEVPLPPLSEQRAIAHVLSTVRDAIEATERVIAAAHELKRSLMKHLFTYGPVPVDQAENVLLKETEFSYVPQTWDIRPLKECAFVQTGAAKGRKLGDAPTIEVPYLRVANVQDGYLDLSEIKYIRIKSSEIDRYGLQDGDVVLTEGGDFDKLGRGFIWEGQIPNCIHQNHIFAVRANEEILSPEYLAYLVQSDYGKAYFLKVAHRTTNLASINSTKLKAFPALIPEPSEQDRIVSQIKAVDEKTEMETQRKDVLEMLFDSLLHHLMTGKLRVPIAEVMEHKIKLKSNSP